MRIRTQFSITVFISVAVLAFTMSMVLVIGRRADSMKSELLRLEKIRNSLSVLEAASYGSLRFRDAERQVQWKDSREQVEAELSNANMFSIDQKRLKERFLGDLAALDANLGQLFGTGPGDREESGARERWNATEAQLRKLQSDADNLLFAIYARMNSLNGLRVLFVILLTLSYAASVLVGSLITNLRLLEPLAAISAGTNVLGSGRLEHRLAWKHDDEIGDLVTAFNTMAENLRNITALRTDLEREIVERKRVEEVLKASETRYADLVRYAPVGIYEIDFLRRRFVSVNDTLCSLSGYSREELLAMDPSLLLDGESREKFRLRLESIEHGDTPPDCVEYRVRARDGHMITAALNMSFRADANGRITGATVIGNDVTGRLREEQALREAMEHAEAAKVAAEEANAAKSEFLAHMSHEIRTPIGAIIGLIDVMHRRTRDEELRNYLALIKESASSLLTIIGDILDLSRIESGTVELEISPWKLRKELSLLAAQFRTFTQKKGLALVLEIGDNVPDAVMTDGEKVIRILRNLVSNAIKYTSRGFITIAVTGTDTGSGRMRLRFAVKDTGIGIPPDKWNVIFESFVRLRKSVREKKSEGTGLGLTITKRLVELLGSTIRLDSAEGEGSVFSFSLEVETCTERPEWAAEGAAHLSEVAPLSILVAEDNKINSLFLEAMLQDAGHLVTLAQNGKEALEILGRPDERIDLVLMDIQMPIMDGIEATRAIRAFPDSRAALPIIALTAFAMKGDEEKFLAAGMNGYVTKPVNWEELSRMIRSLVQSGNRS